MTGDVDSECRDSMIAACDLLALAGTSLDIEISWVKEAYSGKWEATLGLLAPLSRLSNLRSVTIRQFWQHQKAQGQSNPDFASHLKLFTGVTSAWSLPKVSSYHSTDYRI